MATARRTPARPRPVWLVLGTTGWLLLASEISNEENAATLAQILGVAAWSLLAASGAGYLLVLASKAAVRLVRLAVRFICSRWPR